MNEDKIKESFRKIKEDMNFFHTEIENIKRTLERLENATQKLLNPTTPTQIPTNQHPINPYKAQIQGSSTGNEGVPTLHPTNHPTLQHPLISTDKFALNNSPNIDKKGPDKIARLQQISHILESLDELKKEVRQKFKKLTKQEMLIFSTLYQLEELNIEPTYDLIASKLNLSEISVRDYVRKIIQKGIPVDKIKSENNKVTLSISKDLKKIASLSTILQLREL